MCSEHSQQLKRSKLQEKFLYGCLSNKKYMYGDIRLFDFTKYPKFVKRSKKVELPKYWIWKITFIHNFHQQEKFWNHLLDSMLRKVGHKSSHHVYLSRPGWKNRHIKIKAWQLSSRLVFYPVPALI